MSGLKIGAETQGIYRDKPEGAALSRDEELAALRAEYATLAPEPVDEELRRAREDLEFAKAQKRMGPKVRLGRLRVEPGQIIFRGLTTSEIAQVDAAYREEEEGELLAPLPNPAKGKGALLSRVLSRHAVISPDQATLAEWCELYSMLDRELGSAVTEHNMATRKARQGK